jgi:hypothetical protein
MPRGPDGQSRHRHIGNAVHIARIATWEIEDSELKQSAKHRSCFAVSEARSESKSDADRRESSRLAAEVRWKK